MKYEEIECPYCKDNDIEEITRNFDLEDSNSGIVIFKCNGCNREFSVSFKVDYK